MSGDQCPACGWPDSSPVTLLSRHPTVEGTVCYVRCVCGSVSVRLEPHSTTAARVLARGGATRPDADKPDPPADGSG